MFRLFIVRKNIIFNLFALVLIGVISISSILQFILLPLPVFGFHGIIEQNRPNEMPSRSSSLDYSLQNIEKLLTYLVKNDYWFLSTQEFYDYFVSKSKTIPEDKQNSKPVMLTFDDGYKNIDLYLLPLLQKLQQQSNKPIKIVLFINPKHMNSDDSQKKVKYLKCEDLKRGTELGFYDVQSHGYSHVDVTRLTPQELEYELSESQQALKTCISNLPYSKIVAQHIAYPYNKVNKNVEKITSNYYQSGYLFNSRLRNLLFFTNPYKIPRIGVYKKDWPENLIQFAKRY
ncbi:polysaccharide deacetylase [Aphanothece hegewaldii CCALA 016]|uniref:Polysaccharide deacetylase n=1 Tax=Aphanothece hegewaldii CCALA 016 TaxID=2107694 RepID=A0A2T1LWJ6_9CHRO|nr:polysaccharide deacetylase family protein [Aphanothece hegewaldii]PSF36268.1 polysaccharide deacetylase [Aphanothece hegewaldii CCALA 016]